MATLTRLWDFAASWAEHWITARTCVTAWLPAAELLGLSAEIGTLEAGKIADYLVLDGDPLKDVAAYKAVIAVARNGLIYTPEALLAPGQGALPTAAP